MRKKIWELFLGAALVALVHGQTLDEYVVDQCRQVGVPLGVALAILGEENPDLKFNAVHVNENGTRDLGLWQLNERWLERDFLLRHWGREESFRWDNPYHSTYIAVRHIRWLYDRGINHWQVILAYNCGYGALVSNEAPDVSVDYANRVFARVVWLD
jgi:hypothetical protein